MFPLRLEKKFGFVYLLPSLFLAFSSAHGQVETQISGSPEYCRLLPGGDVVARYPVIYSFANHESKAVKLEFSIDHQLIYEMFRDKSGVKTRDFVQMNNPDYFDEGPPTETHRVKPGETLQWKGIAPVYLAEGHEPLTRPGLYYVLPFPGVVFNGKLNTQPDEYDTDRLIPLMIAAPPREVEDCRHLSKEKHGRRKGTT